MVDTVKANEGVVTSIGDTDLVMVCASGGGLKPISFANLMAAVRGGIQIGGRNLLSIPKNTTNARVLISDGVVTMLGDQDTYFNIPYANPDLMAVGETYTLSFDCDGMKEGNRWSMNGAQGSSQFNIELKNGRCSTTFVLNDKQFKEGSTSFGFDDGVRSFPNGFSPVKLSNFKLERGNIATDWTPAPEDIASGAWGGVIGCLPITCGLIGKGGAHDGYNDADRAAEGGADSHLSFRTLDTLCEWLGSACEKGSHACGEWVSEDLGYKRRSGLDCREIGCLIQYNPELSRNRIGIDTDHFPKLSDNFESRRWRRNLLPDFCEPELDGLEKSIVDFRVADRKEVAYV